MKNVETTPLFLLGKPPGKIGVEPLSLKEKGRNGDRLNLPHSSSAIARNSHIKR